LLAGTKKALQRGAYPLLKLPQRNKEQTMNRNPIWWSIAQITVVCIGCGEDVAPQDLGKISEAAKPPETKTEAPVDIFAAPANPGSDPTYGQPSSPQNDGAGAASAPANTYGQGAPIVLKSEVDNPDLVKAQGGVGKRGQGYGGGIITEPVRQRFVLQDRITFLNMLNTLKVYRAENNDKNPATIQEFIDKIVTPSGLTLPELPAGHFYVYDPQAPANDLESVLLVDQTQSAPPAQAGSGR
jgi:hypothetical protein